MPKRRGDRGAQQIAEGPSEADRESDAMSAQRAVFDEIKKKRQAEPRFAANPERDAPREGGADAFLEDFPAEEGFDDDHSEAPDDERHEETGDEEAASRSVTDREYARAVRALERADVSDDVLDSLTRSQVVDLAEGIREQQAHADRALRAASQDGGARDAAPETPEPRAVASEADLERAASQVAGTLGIEADKDAVRALKEFAKAAGGHDELVSLRGTVGQLTGLVESLVLDQAMGTLRESYPGLKPRDLKRVRARMLRQAQAGGYEGDLERLAQDSALLEGLGSPKTARRSTTPKRQRGGPTVSSRKKPQRAPQPGTDEHDRAVFARIASRNRGIAGSRR